MGEKREETKREKKRKDSVWDKRREIKRMGRAMIEEPRLRGHGLGLVSSRAGISGLESFKIKSVKQQQCSIHKPCPDEISSLANWLIFLLYAED
ncbi:hypothetical protein RHMOL_Rhmol04G0012800 [Rhododendron molle]|uniref:Uncharacterized protein n=1 Tax=Rhododendron molle TaxID=49168 RepID=A0ACC0NVT0_RHOML|nr:hypothetical protein RHMOL_Rhmol04G0012800 [Rhododendron molle]